MAEKICPACASTNVSYSEHENALICRDCGMIYAGKAIIEEQGPKLVEKEIAPKLKIEEKKEAKEVKKPAVKKLEKKVKKAKKEKKAKIKIKKQAKKKVSVKKLIKPKKKSLLKRLLKKR